MVFDRLESSIVIVEFSAERSAKANNRLREHARGLSDAKHVSVMLGLGSNQQSFVNRHHAPPKSSLAGDVVSVLSRNRSK